MSDLLVLRLIRNEAVASESDAQRTLERFHSALQEHLRLGRIGWVYEGESDYVWDFDPHRAITSARNVSHDGTVLGWQLVAKGGGRGGITISYSLAVDPKTVNTATFVRDPSVSMEGLALLASKLMRAVDAQEVLLWEKSSGAEILRYPPSDSATDVVIADSMPFQVLKRQPG